MTDLLKAAALISTLLLSPWSQAAHADCRLVFEGETYIDGPCDFKPAAGGSFRMDAAGYSVQVDVFAEDTGSPLRLQLDRAGQWILMAPTGGKPKGFQGVVDAEFHKASGQLKARVDPTGQRMLMSLTANDLQMLEAGANLQLGYGPVPAYRFEKTRQAIAKLRQCVKG